MLAESIELTELAELAGIAELQRKKKTMTENARIRIVLLILLMCNIDTKFGKSASRAIVSFFRPRLQGASVLRADQRWNVASNDTRAYLFLLFYSSFIRPFAVKSGQILLAISRA